ncbi:MAG: magnesium transporter [Tenericutes bacterium HGW-Tenericutes-1]|jgi:magnesium transporter|nr:MAG: magnesium transporter [Tenericutes bacterium HGW-Tenericutes-1]
MEQNMEYEVTPIESIIQIVKQDIPLEQKRLLLDEFHNFDLANGILAMTPSQRKILYACFPPKQLADIFEQLEPEDVVLLFRSMSLVDVGKIINFMEVDDLVDVMQEFTDRNENIKYLGLLDITKRNEIKQLIDYDDTVVGSIMNTNFVELTPNMTVKQAIKTMVKMAEDIEFINVLYVVENQKLVGAISLKEIISAGNTPEKLISDIMTVNLITVTPETKNEEAIFLMQNYDFLLLPVVDDDYDIIGIVSFDDMFETMNYESDMDYSRLAGVTDVTIDEDTENVVSSVKKRIPWLIILLFINLITSGIITGFESILTAIPTLALFMPLILNMAGNTGTQSLGVIIRLFASNQLTERKDIFKHLLREFLTGIVNGIVIGILMFIMVLVIKLLDGLTLTDSLTFAKVTSISIAVALTTASIAGSGIPLLMKLIKVDPAVASGPFITTINDIISLLIYFGLATLMLSELM